MFGAIGSEIKSRETVSQRFPWLLVLPFSSSGVVDTTPTAGRLSTSCVMKGWAADAAFVELRQRNDRGVRRRCYNDKGTRDQP